jgi:CDP-4-dehydro-6-deoxyglucose reductase, E1
MEKRTIRYGGAMLDHREIEAVTAVMKKEFGMVVGEQVQAFEKECAPLLGHE